MRHTFLRKVFLWTVIVLGGFYLVTIAYLKLNEEAMIFFPDKTLSGTPADSGWAYADISIPLSGEIHLNGWKINGITENDSLPVVLFLHGNAGNISGNMSALSVLRQAAVNVYAFDYRGYGRSGGQTTSKTFPSDCEAMLDYLINHEKIAQDKIIVYGHSLGSYGAAWLASQHSALKGLVMEAAFTSIPDRAAELYTILPIHRIMSVEMNNLELMPQIHIPVLFISSKKDMVIPINHNQALYKAANEPKYFLQLDKGSHLSAIQINQKAVLKTFHDFFIQH